MKASYLAASLLVCLGTVRAGSLTLTPGSVLVQQIAVPSLTTANLQTYTKSGSLIASSQVTTTKDIAESLTVLGGNLYVSDGAGYVNQVDLATGNSVPLFFAGNFGLDGLGSLNGNLLTLTFGATAVNEYSTAGVLVQTIKLASYPASLNWNGIASDGTTLYLADYASGRIYEYSLTGTLLGFISTGATNGLSGVSYDASNSSLWIANSAADEVADLSTSGSTLSQFSLVSFRPGSGIAVVPGGSPVNTPEPGYKTLLLISITLAGARKLRQTKALKPTVEGAAA